MAEAVRYNRFLMSLVTDAIRTEDKMLDFGAGIGTFALPLMCGGTDVLCVEPDARELKKIAGSEVKVVDRLADVDNASIYLIYTFNVLEHIEDDGQVLQQFDAKLKPRGRLLIYVPAFQVLFSSMDRNVGHVRRYSRKDLSDKVRKRASRSPLLNMWIVSGSLQRLRTNSWAVIPGKYTAKRWCSTTVCFFR
jgi:SAM-dependent methyltransferase